MADEADSPDGVLAVAAEATIEAGSAGADYVAHGQSFAECDSRVSAGNESRTCTACGKVFPLKGHKRNICYPCQEQRRTSRKTGGAKPSVMTDCARDLGQAMVELGRAIDEFAAVVQVGETGYRRAALLQDPLSRLDLVSGFCDSVLRRFGRKKSTRNDADDEDCDSSKFTRRSAD
jgi:hypothetical protein